MLHLFFCVLRPLLRILHKLRFGVDCTLRLDLMSCNLADKYVESKIAYVVSPAVFRISCSACLG